MYVVGYAADFCVSAGDGFGGTNIQIKRKRNEIECEFFHLYRKGTKTFC